MTAWRGWIAWLMLLATLALAATPAAGQGVRAFLDRNHVSLGDTVTLNIQADGSIGNPDLSPLQKDFEVLGTSRSSSVQIANGKTTRTSQLGVALKPLHAGTLTIPALDIGGSRTQPLTLQVGAAASGGTGKTGDPVFMEAEVRSTSPYVGQQTVYTVRLFYLPEVNGALGDPHADGARLIPLDRDHRYLVERKGYTYKVIERSWALIPQRSGAVSVQGPEFQGQRLGPGFPNAWFNTPPGNPNALLNAPLQGFGGAVRAAAPTVKIEARPKPAQAGKPWLPARDVQLKLDGLPADGKVDASSPLTVTLSISAVGQPADALPQPELPALAGARVYPGRTRDSTDDSGEWLRGVRTRSFAIVPDRNGTLTIPAITLHWWDVAHDHAEQAELPAHTLSVSGAAAGAPSNPAPAASAPAKPQTRAATPVPQAPTAPSAFWRNIAVASLALWLVAAGAFAAWWWLRGRRRGAPGTAASSAGADAAGQAAPAPATTAEAAKPEARALRQRALEAARADDAAGCERALLAWARTSRPRIINAGALRDALSDATQRDALDALRHARWQGGDASAACAQVTQAFARGFAWHDGAARRRESDPDLPPLYPS